MARRYPGLYMVSSLFRVLGVILIIAGFAASIYCGFQFVSGEMTTLIIVGGIVGSIIVGLAVYSVGDFYHCVMDIEANTRQEDKTPLP